MPSQVWNPDFDSVSQPVWVSVPVRFFGTPRRWLALDPQRDPRLPPYGLLARATMSKRKFLANPLCGLSSMSLVVSISPYWKTYWVKLLRENVSVVLSLPKQKY
jgi:hypothetical protein